MPHGGTTLQIKLAIIPCRCHMEVPHCRLNWRSYPAAATLQIKLANIAHRSFVSAASFDVVHNLCQTVMPLFVYIPLCATQNPRVLNAIKIYSDSDSTQEQYPDTSQPAAALTLKPQRSGGVAREIQLFVTLHHDMSRNVPSQLLQ